jgi:hypothetical protein
MNSREIVKVVVLILIPLNTWLLVLWYVKKQQRELFLPSIARHQFNTEVRVRYFQEKLGLQPGKKLVYPFPAKGKLTLVGKPPPIGQGYPVIFINIDWLTYPEVWEPAIKEAFQASPNLHIVLLHYFTEFDFDPKLFKLLPDKTIKHIERNLKYAEKAREKMWKHFRSHRLSIISGQWVRTAFGGQFGGILAFLCDGDGIVRVVEPYPPLKLSPRWSEEVSDWRPKLHQAVKRALEKFFGKPSGKQDG